MKKLFLVIAVLSSIIACHKGPAESNQPHHDTTYIWGGNNWDAVWPADKVAASADSVLVDNVYLKNDGVSLSGLDVTWAKKNMEAIIDCVSKKNQHKIRGAGSLRHLYITDKSDSTWLSQFGFTFTEPRYK